MHVALGLCHCVAGSQIHLEQILTFKCEGPKGKIHSPNPILLYNAKLDNDTTR